MDILMRHGSGLLLLVLAAVVLILPGAAAAAQDPEPATQDTEQATQDTEATASEDDDPIIELSSGEEAVADEVIVKFKEEVSETTKEDTRSDEGLEKKEDLDLINAEVVEVEDQSVEDAISELEARPEVEYAEPNHINYPTSYTDEDRFGELWGLHNTRQKMDNDGNPNTEPVEGAEGVDVNALKASAVAQGEDVVVAVIDDGVDFSHPDLAGREWTNSGETPNNGLDDDKNGYVDDVKGWDFHNKDSTVHDAQDFHGTHVAGTIAASLNDQGVVGVAPQVKIMALKYLGPRGGATANAIDAIEYAVEKGAKISNNSWGSNAKSQSLEDAIRRANINEVTGEKPGMLFVASAGNSGRDLDERNQKGELVQPYYPASYDLPNILSVAAVDNQGNLARFSNYGAESVDVSAPGVSVLSSLPSDRPDHPAVTLSSVPNPNDSSKPGQAVVAGFGVDEIGTTGSESAEETRESFMRRALAAVGHDVSPNEENESYVSKDEVVLIDDDASSTLPTLPLPEGVSFPNVGPSLSTAIRSATGKAPQTLVNVPYGAQPAASVFTNAKGKTMVWATGQSYFTRLNTAGTAITTPTLTPDDRLRLDAFLKDGGRLILTGMDALYLIENQTLVTQTFGLRVQSDVNYLKTFRGSSGTKFAGESYNLNGPTSDSDRHDALANRSSRAVAQGLYPRFEPWGFLNGTSMAAPHATGVAALAASVNSDLLGRPMDPSDTRTNLKDAVMKSAEQLPSGSEGKAPTDRKIVDARAALTRADETAPRISGLPTSDLMEEATSPAGAKVEFPTTIKATDNVDGELSVTCVSDSGLRSGDTFPVGTTEITCDVSDKAGNKATGTFNVRVYYDFRGFFSPVDNPGTLNRVNAGRAIPVKFTLGGDMGPKIFYEEDGSTYPRSASMTCSSAGAVDAIEETVTANSSGLSYDDATGQYNYVWKTSKDWAGTCRQLVVKLKDGETYRAYFQFS